MRLCYPLLNAFLIGLLSMPATTLATGPAQQDAVRWHNDLESAKVSTKETKRLVLVHFWTPNCGPCLGLDQNVFNQPGVAGGIELSLCQ